MRCTNCDEEPCMCSRQPIRSVLPPIRPYQPLQSGPYVSMEEALKDFPEHLARLKRLLE